MMQRQVASAALLIMLGNIVSRLLGLVREQVMAALFGATGATDAFVAASAVPMIVYDLLIGGAISAALVPVFVDHRDDDERLWAVASSLISLAAIALCAIALVLAVLAPVIVTLLGGGFDLGQREQATTMVRVMMISVILQGLAGVLMALQYARQRFAAPAFAPAMYNGAIILAALVLHTWMGVEALVIGVVLGAAAQLGLQVACLGGWRYRPTLGLDRAEVQLALRLYAPVAGGMLVTILGILIDRNLASRLDEGSMTVMNYATRLIQFPLGLVGVAISSAALPTLSSQDSTDASHVEQYRSTLLSGIRLVMFLMVPALMGIGLLNEPLVQLMFQRGAFSSEDTDRTALVLLAYVPQLPLTALDQLLIVAFYARKDTRTPVLVGVFTVGVYVVTALLLLEPFGVVGLALANAVQNSLHGLVLLALLQRNVRGVITRSLWSHLARVTLASLGMGVAVWFGRSLVVTSDGDLQLAASLGFIGLFGACVYLGLAAVLRLPEPGVLVGALWMRRTRD